jgi:hypothetical protein
VDNQEKLRYGINKEILGKSVLDMHMNYTGLNYKKYCIFCMYGYTGQVLQSNLIVQPVACL